MPKSKIKFDASTHTYTLGGKELISVTTLLKKHGLVADVSHIDEGVLRRAGERGTAIHAELENFVKTGDMGFTQEVEWFKEWVDENRANQMQAEQIVHNDLVAGTVDLTGILAEDTFFIADFKTASKLDKQGVRWQLSLYAYLLNVPQELCSNLIALHFTPDGMKEIYLDPIPAEEIEKLLDAERNFQLYQQQLITLDELELEEVKEFERQYLILDSLEAQIKAHKDYVHKMFLAKFEQYKDHGLDAFETEHVRFKYVAEHDKAHFDKTALKKKYPQIYAEFDGKTKVKPSLRITLKNQKQEEQ